ncbi:uncharacterized protein LOC116850792 [Odontomachus brunneus]|uniref:uncharacterized protein LOC116850792 n=1 Tax=Odontomachus brunneus TaxID=486640 RepID=UPI0013F1E3FE|nr:uncharacterized protein LOC116850792 [Odontomachus brunneus]XP_032685338.1 uncharacterized protein LOC116850792 [Odontomachus brunneus]
MRIEALSTLVAVVWLTAVLCPRLAAANNLTYSFSSRKNKDHLYREHVPHFTLEGMLNKRMTLREMEYLLHKELIGTDGNAVECCPAIVDMVEPIGGRNRRNMFVQLFRNGDITQRFFEYSCRTDVLDRPCKFIDWRLSNRSKCVQKFAYVYAIVNTTKVQDYKEGHPETKTEWALDYIRVRSGCSCEIMPKTKKKKAALSKARRAKSKLHQLRDLEFDYEI